MQDWLSCVIELIKSASLQYRYGENCGDEEGGPFPGFVDGSDDNPALGGGGEEVGKQNGGCDDGSLGEGYEEGERTFVQVLAS